METQVSLSHSNKLDLVKPIGSRSLNHLLRISPALLCTEETPGEAQSPAGPQLPHPCFTCDILLGPQIAPRGISSSASAIISPLSGTLEGPGVAERRGEGLKSLIIHHSFTQQTFTSKYLLNTRPCAVLGYNSNVDPDSTQMGRRGAFPIIWPNSHFRDAEIESCRGKVNCPKPRS